MKLALDHHYSKAIAAKLRERGFDVVAAIDRGWEAQEDESLLAICCHERCALMTNNVADFSVIARRWAVEGHAHSGLIFTSDEIMPRSRAAVGRYVKALEQLLRSNSADGAFEDRVHWL